MGAQTNTAGPAALLKQQLAARLKTAIVDGRLRPGQRVVEGAWAREFGTAQASVREAINLLIAEGFLVKSAGRSARVPNYSEQDIARIYQVRGALEGLAAQLAVEARADLAPLERALRRMKAAAARGDVDELIGSDLEFHLALGEASANPVLADTLARLLRPLFAFVLLRMKETGQATGGWDADLPLHREALFLMRQSSPAVAGQFVQHCVSRFGASAHQVWTPAARAGHQKRS